MSGLVIMIFSRFFTSLSLSTLWWWSLVLSSYTYNNWFDELICNPSHATKVICNYYVCHTFICTYYVDIIVHHQNGYHAFVERGTWTRHVYIIRILMLIMGISLIVSSFIKKNIIVSISRTHEGITCDQLSVTFWVIFLLCSMCRKNKTYKKITSWKFFTYLKIEKCNANFSRSCTNLRF